MLKKLKGSKDNTKIFKIISNALKSNETSEIIKWLQNKIK